MADDQDIGETTYVHSSPGPCMSCCICSFVSGCCRFIWKWVLVEDVMVDGKDGSGAERVVAGLRVDIMIYRKCFMIRREPNLINRDRDHISTMTFLDQSKAISILYHQSHSQSAPVPSRHRHFSFYLSCFFRFLLDCKASKDCSNGPTGCYQRSQRYDNWPCRPWQNNTYGRSPSC